ncbi:hypothetical protein BD309DRAFT_346314 [Dichomitus squalens]|nr:hypothetical protein BD309DRAFT_346314 [Dichomitus squalens]
MRLLDTHTGQFVEKDPKAKDTLYAILSHTWDPAGEQTFKQLSKIQKRYASKSLKGRSEDPFRHISVPSLSSSAVAVVSVSDERTTLLRRADPTSLMEEGLLEQGSRTTADVRRSALVHTFRWIWEAALFTLTAFLTLLVPMTGVRERIIWDDPELSPKIREACRVARQAGYRYLWIDSCCINKMSSSELSEAINSMYMWYRLAKVCYAYLTDVPTGEDPRAPQSAFRKSRWFKRGWTLQELIAPFSVTFLSKDWKKIGTKLTLGDLVDEITGIPDEALFHSKSLDQFSVAQRLSWAALRETTREEDRAYSLLGIFDINMPTLYGEGERAFRRLQEEIVRRIPDLSLFAWRPDVYQNCGPDQDVVQGLHNAQSFHMWRVGLTPFDSDVHNFTRGGKIISIPDGDVFRRLELKDLPAPEYTFTPHGIRTTLPVIPLSLCLPQRRAWYPGDTPQSRWFLVILSCEHNDYPGALLGQVCYILPSESGVEHLYYGAVQINIQSKHGTEWPDLFLLSPVTIKRCRERIAVRTVYISKPKHSTLQPGQMNPLDERHESLNLVLQRKTHDVLRAQGYAVKLRGPDEDPPVTHWVTLSNDDHTITIKYQHTLENGGRKLSITAAVTISRLLLDSAWGIEAVPHTLKWQDTIHWWRTSLCTQNVALTLGGKRLTVQLGFILAAPSHYFLHIAVSTETLQAVAPTLRDSAPAEELRGTSHDRKDA